MEIINNIKDTRKVTFDSLNIGDIYIDEEDVVCIKTSGIGGDGFGDCIFCNFEGWQYGNQSADSLVLPVKATLTLTEIGV
jgi:hypothetical protein